MAQGGKTRNGAFDRARDARRKPAAFGVALGPRATPSRPHAGVLGAEPEIDFVSSHFLITPQWTLMAPGMCAALLLTALASWVLPGAMASSLAITAILLVAAAPLFVSIERRHPQRMLLRYAIMATAVALPMLLFGLSIARWAYLPGGVNWESSVGVLVIIGTLAAILLHGRPSAIMAAQVALWLGAALIVGSMGTFMVMAVGALISVGFSLHQTRLSAGEAARRREAQRVQSRAGQLLAEYEQSGNGWFWETDRRGAIVYVSPRIGELLERDSEALVGRPLTELFILDADGQEGERTLNFHLSARSSFQELAVRAGVRDDEERWWSISGRPIHDEFNNFIGFRGSGTDLTEKRRSEQHASRLAHYDSLTGLANRFQMSQTLEKILNAQREDHRACAVFLLDLDRFKQVNDTLGHPAGDALLKQVAQRLERTVDKAGRVGRLGGDEFQVILPGYQDEDGLTRLAEQIIENLSQPYLIEGHRVVIGVSVGIALSPDDGVTSEALIRNADLALYAAKDGGRGRHHFYAPDLHSDAEERRQLEQDLRDAITHGGLELYYQPVVHTATEKITGFEALIRWTHPTLGRLSPAKFVPIAEDAGLIAQIGEWALRTACLDLASWPESVRVAVNVSPLQFANPALPAIVTSALASAQVAPARLELEITESVFLNDDSSTEAMFTALKRVGVRLALDDFGTGYSSLGYLKKAPFDKIKIDQSFVRGATIPGSRNGAIIASIVSLAEALDMETTAEGVETLDELDLVRTLGCSHVQGFIYEKPLSASAARLRLGEGLGAIARGPRSARDPRRTMLRKVVLEYGGDKYGGTIRNISTTGAMIEGLWHVPVGTEFGLHIARGYLIGATTRWSAEDRMGVVFATPLQIDEQGRIALPPPAARPTPPEEADGLRRTA
ncbi:MAG: EAL domain-containing protein [Novosphingobium sp.]|nr:EAL domain-containing protein [Novosphingobium sp.]